MQHIVPLPRRWTLLSHSSLPLHDDPSFSIGSPLNRGGEHSRVRRHSVLSDHCYSAQHCVEGVLPYLMLVQCSEQQQDCDGTARSRDKRGLTAPSTPRSDAFPDEM